VCEAMFPDPQPDVPFGKQTEDSALFTESGFRQTVGRLTNGRYLVFQEPNSNKGLAVQSSRGHSTLGSSSVPTQKESEPAIRFIIYEQGIFPDMKYKIQSAFLKDSGSSSSYLDSELEFTSNEKAEEFIITYDANSLAYTIQVESSNKFISIDKTGKVSLSSSSFQFSSFAVSF
jgi:phospholipase C